ncbi:nuclear pore complex protein Nup214 [Xylocopa sonorina]|uniref:nuclear pore complex protein Nup214 n=1 Tax=Xylocopa sonorina TaxID=1818115 RepID=UPI00403A8299
MKTASDPKDVQEFQFKQSNTCQILDAFTSVPTACSLLAADKKRGLLYAGQNDKIVILKPGENCDPEWKIELNLSVAVSKLMLNCDCTYLAVAPNGPLILIYDAQALTKSSLQLLYEIRVSTLNADVFVNDLRWNPAVAGMLCTIASDYTVGSFKIKEKKEKTIELKALEKFNNLDALCAAWSPKGKQIVVGCKNGSIVQFKPDLKIARTIPGPNPYIGGVVSILWISNYQFCAAYLGNEQGINVLVVDAPKGEANAVFTCYEDITYGVTDAEGEGVIPRYYFDHVPEWSLIIAASSNSSEIAVLGSADKGVTWSQWQLVDSGRAELPLICTTESYPVGLAIDKSPAQRLPWGADSTLPYPVPILHILSTSGQLCSFHMVNLFPNCPPINSPPTEIIATPPQAQSSIAPDTSLITNGLITSTPRGKQSENTSERKPIVTGNIFDKFLKGNNLFPQTATEKPKQQEQKSENFGIEMKLESAREIHPQETVKPDIKLMSVKETVAQEVVEQKPSPDDEARDICAYFEEYTLFKKELQDRSKPLTWKCGTDDERQKLEEKSEIIDHFLQELRKATNGLSSDIAYLKALLLQSFAWVEETKSKNAATNDLAIRNSGDSTKISDLQKLFYYTETQLTQASRILDLELSDHKSQERSRMKIPYLEFVYQNLVLHNKIILQEKHKVEQLKKKLRSIACNNSIYGLNRSISNLSIGSSKSSVTLSRNTNIIDARCRAIASKTLNFTRAKQLKLIEHLSKSTPATIKPVQHSPIQQRFEVTFSSSTSTTDSKNKVEQAVSKQSPLPKQQTIEKPKQQSPLASLNSIVARIGTNETNSVSPQDKTQKKQTIFDAVFPPMPSGNKPLQSEKISCPPTTTAVIQTVKPKQDNVAFNQVNASTLLNLMKSFPKVDSITFGTSAQKPGETAAHKSTAKESSIKTGKETVSDTDSFKVENSLFSANSLKDALSSEIASSDKAQISSGGRLKSGMAVASTTAGKSEAMSTFSFVSATTSTMSVKSTPQSTFAGQQTTAAQAFSFASKPSSTSAPFDLKVTPSTATPQTQDSLTLTGLFAGLQSSNQTLGASTGSNLSADGKYNYKPTFGTPGFQVLWGQNATNNQVSNFHQTPEASGTTGKETTTATSSIAITPSVTIEKVFSAESKASTLPTSSVQTLAVSSAGSLFSGQTNTPSISIFGGMSSSLPTTSTFTVTTTAPTVQTTTTSSMLLFSNFGTTPASSPATTSLTTTSSTMSPFQSTLPKPTFGEAAISLPTVNTTNVTTTTSSTLTFGNVATTTVASVFGKPSLPMNTQFPSTPPVSSAAETFGKPVSPTFKPFGNTSLFGQMPTSTSAATNFSGGNTSSIFGGNAQPASAASIFGGNASTINTFGTPQKSIFDNNTQKSGSIFGSPANTGPTSFFGGTANNVAPVLASPGSPSVFSNAAANQSPLGVEQPVGLGAQPVFGQTPSFNTKPVFGSSPTFGAPKQIFGGGFGATAFGASAAPPAFGSPPTMGGNPAPIDNNMPKVFGSVSGSTTFESLASQSGGLSFSSLAQKSPEAPKTPVFTSGSSFSTWR